MNVRREEGKRCGITWPMVRLPLPLGIALAQSAYLRDIPETVRSGSIPEGRAPRQLAAR